MHQDNKIFLKSQDITNPTTLLFEAIIQQQSVYLCYSKLVLLVEVHCLIKKSIVKTDLYMYIYVYLEN